jgi:site-specific DNA recombinase
MTHSNRLRAAFYARVSSEKQAEEGTIASQVVALQERLRQEDIGIEEDLAFIDDGYTGTTLVRPALERLRDLAASGMLDRLYVHSPDRLARKYAYQVLLVDEFQRCGVEVVFLNHAIGGTPEDQLLLQVQGMVAEYERAKLLERCRRGKLHTARQGCVNALAGAPYGYRYVRKADGGGTARYDVVLEEARIVQQIFDWVGRERVALAEVCRRLQQRGIRTRTGKVRWDSSTIGDMLRNPAYKGTAVYGRWRLGPRRPRLRPPRGQPEQPRQPYSVYAAEEPGITIAVPALVSPELFAAVAEQLDENRMRNRQSRRGARWLLQGLLVCKVCGYALYGLASRCRLADGRTAEYAHYRCTGRNGWRFGGQPICSSRRQVPVAELDHAVWSDVCDLLRNPAKIQAEYERRRQEPTGEKRSLQADQIGKQIHKVKRAITRLIDAYEEGMLNKGEFAPRLKAAKDRLARLEEEERKEAEQHDQERELRLALGGLEEFAQQVKEGLDQANWHKRREIIRALVKRVEVGPEEVRIVYRVSPPPFANGPWGGTLEHCGRALEPTLPKVADEAVAAVEVVNVGAQQPGQAGGQLLRALAAQQDVEVIAHEAIVKNLDREALPVAVEQLQEVAVVRVVLEHDLAVVAAVHDVVVRAGRPLQVPRDPRHDAAPSRQSAGLAPDPSRPRPPSSTCLEIADA